MIRVKIFPAFADLRIAELIEEVFDHVIKKCKDDTRFVYVSTHDVPYCDFPH